jgi:hypothetical protein
MSPPFSVFRLLPAFTLVLAWLIFRSEDGGDKLLRNVRLLTTDYRALYPEGVTLYDVVTCTLTVRGFEHKIGGEERRRQR